MRENSTHITKGSRATIIGGGIGGLAAAIALRNHFTCITVLERDHHPDTPTVRKYAPQGHHVHLLLARGLETLTRLVPEFTTWLDEMDLCEGDLTRDVRFCFGGKWLPRVDSGIPIRPCTRPIIEHLLLRAATQHGNINIRHGCTVQRLTDRDAVTNIEFSNEKGVQESISTDWTVAASGRASKKPPLWLQELLGRPIPTETIDAGLTYSSCSFRPTPSTQREWMFLVDANRFPSQPEMAVVTALSADEWLAALITYGRAEPPRTVEDLLKRTEHLSSNAVANVLQSSTPLSTKIRHYSNTGNRWRRFGKMNSWPNRFVALGDMVCALNPRYGQGMTVAFISTEKLALDMENHWDSSQTLDGLSRKYQVSLEKEIGTPWRIATMEDALWVRKFAGAKQSTTQRLVERGLHGFLEAAFSDIHIYSKFMRVAHMLDKPSSLMDLSTVAKVLVPGLRTKG